MYDINEFKELYIKLESWANAKYGKDGMRSIEDEHSDGKVRYDMKYFRNIRNVLTHNPNGCNPLVELTDEFKLRFEGLCNRLMSSIMQVAVPYANIYKREMSDRVMPTIVRMKEKAYSHVPIMNAKKLWGVFSETALFNIVGDGNIAMINEEARLFEIGKYVTGDINGEFYDFIGEDASIEDARMRFYEAVEKNRRLELLCITTNGNKSGDLVAIVTIWDMAGV